MPIALVEASKEIITLRLAHLPELQPSLQLAKDSPKFFKPERTFMQYIGVIREMTLLSTEEIDLIVRANHTIGQPGADIFLQILNSSQKRRLHSRLYGAANPNSKTAKKALEQLVTMADGAQELVREGASPSDSDPRFDKVIWGYTQIKGTHIQLLPTMTHFFTCHYLERFTAACLAEEDIHFKKDLLLNSMGDVITLKYIKNGKSPLFWLWNKPKKQAGLGWISDQKLEAYQQMFT